MSTPLFRKKNILKVNIQTVTRQTQTLTNASGSNEETNMNKAKAMTEPDMQEVKQLQKQRSREFSE